MKTVGDRNGAPQRKGPAMTSPESLDDYIRVTSPPVWGALIGLLAIVLGIFLWAILGQLKIEVHSKALVEGGKMICYVPIQNIGYLSEDSTFTVAGQTLRCGEAPVRTVLSTGEEAKLLGEHGIDPMDVVAVELSASLNDGLYDALLVVETVSPLKLILG